MAEVGPQAQDIPVPPPLWLILILHNKYNNLCNHFNWSHFKPDFSGKSEDAEAHLLQTNDWMNAHHFLEGIKVQRFCLTLVGEARLWYESLRPIIIDWQGLQSLFRQQYSKIGNTREQLFHKWRSFHFDENTEAIDAYVTCIRQVATLIGYGEPQILEVFKNTLPTKVNWVLFPIYDFRQAVETAERILTKEKIDRQLARQSSSTPFMSLKDSCNKKVTFDTQDRLEDKIDKLTAMMGKLASGDNGNNGEIKPQIYQSRRGQSRNFYDSHNYDRGDYQNRYRSNSRDREIQFSGQSRGRPRYEQNYRRGNFRGNMRMYQNFERQNSRGEHRGNYRNEHYSRERGRSRFRERSFSRNINNRRNDRSLSNSGSRSGSRVSTNRDRIRCYKCREYDHFTKDCPTSEEEREIEQI